MATMDELEKLAKRYIANKKEADDYADICKRDNNELKKLMDELNVTDITVDGTKITKSVSKRVSLNEEKVLTILLDAGLNNSTIIKTKQYVDMDELEKAIYAGLLPQETVLELNNAKVVSPDVVTLRVTKLKRREE